MYSTEPRHQHSNDSIVNKKSSHTAVFFSLYMDPFPEKSELD